MKKIFETIIVALLLACVLPDRAMATERESLAAAISMAVIRFSLPSVRKVPMGSCDPVRITGLARFSSMKLSAEAV